MAGGGQVWGLVLAAGGGTRFGGLKQFADLEGRTLLAHVVDLMADACDGVVAVLPAGHDLDDPRVQVVAGGAVRAESVRNGLAALPPEADVVVVSDAAHPLASPALYAAVIDTVRDGADAAVPGLPLTDAVKAVLPDGTAGTTTPAGGHVSAQMPMAFRASSLQHAHDTIALDHPAAIEDSAMVTAAGGRVVLVAGEPSNLHVTTPEELHIAALLLGDRLRVREL